MLDAPRVNARLASSALGRLARRTGQLLTWTLSTPALAWTGKPALHEALIVALLGTAVFYWRLAALEPIEIGGDALKVWEFARQLVHGGGLPEQFNHHIARFGIVGPVVLAQLIFGSDAWVYYVAPLGASVLLHVFVYGIARKLSGRFGGILAVLLLLGFGEMVRPSSQLLPELFGPAYVCGAYLAALYAIESSSRWRSVWLGLTAVFLFAAYGSKISYLYYAPGLALLVWLGGSPHARKEGPEGTSSSAQEPVNPAEDEPQDTAPGEAVQSTPRASNASQGRSKPGLVGLGRRLWSWAEQRNLRAPLVLAALVCAFLVVEVLFYVLFTRHTSQLDVISETHGSGKRPRIHEFADLFLIYKNAGPEWHQWLGLGLLSGLGVTASSRNRAAPLLVAGLCIYLFLQTFILRSLNPPTPWIKPHSRYLLAVAPLLAIVVAVFVHEAGALAGARMGLLRARWLRTGLSFLVCSGLLAVTASEAKTQYVARWTNKHPIRQAERLQADLTRAFELGIPLVTSAQGAKPLRAAGGLYIEPRLLEEDGKILPYQAFQRRASKQVVYLARDVRSAPKKKRALLDAEVDRRVKARSCRIELGQRNRFLTGQTRVPTRCEPLGSVLTTEDNAEAGATLASQKVESPRKDGSADVNEGEQEELDAGPSASDEDE